jgi:hypothetical protein
MKQQQILILFAIVALAYSLPQLDNMEHYIAQGYELVEHKFGALQLTKLVEGGIDTLVVFPKFGFLSELEHWEFAHSRILAAADTMPVEMSNAILECDAGDKPDFFKFFPTSIGAITPTGQLSFDAPCFSGNYITLAAVDDSTIVVTHVASTAATATCSDAYLYTTSQNFHLGITATSGTHTVTFKNLTPDQFNEMIHNGINIFRFCDKLKNIIPDALMTVEMFFGGLGTNPWIPFFGSHPPLWMQEANVKFIHDSTGYQYLERPLDIVADIDETLIHSGDWFAIVRFDGLDNIIQYGAGSHVGHCTEALWINGTLHVCESQDAWYWPRTHIQCNPYSQWIKWARDASFHVTWLQLKDEYRAMFNETSAIEWVNGMLGYPYGYHNFLFGWVDTEEMNWPPVLRPELVAPVFALVEKISASGAQEVFNAPMNMRLNGGTANWTVSEIAEYIYQQNITFEQLYAQVEQDSWVYYDGPSLVCSSFVAALWRAGGLFGDTVFQATEFTPRNNYEMIFVNPNPTVPLSCKIIDPVNPQCQIMGRWRMEFPGIGTIAPYDNMDEVCQTQAPLFERIPQMC